MSYIRWAYESNLASSEKLNSSWVIKKDFTGSCFKYGWCAAFDLAELVIKSKPWTCEIRVDLFPPNLNALEAASVTLNLFKHYENLMNTISAVGLPFLWETNIEEYSLEEVMVSRTPVLQVFMFPQKSWKFAYQPDSKTRMWKDVESVHTSGTYNMYYFLVDLIHKNSQILTPGSVQHVNLQHQNEVVKTKFETFGPHEISEFSKNFWNGLMHWRIDARVRNIEKFFEICDTAIDSSGFAGDLLSQSLVRVWQSILQNYTFRISYSHDKMCTNGKIVDVDAQQLRSSILVEHIYIRRFLHIPMQVLSTVDGSFRFVVCGIRGSESMAFGELTSAYDKYVWVFLVILIGSAAFTWSLLLSTTRYPHTITRTDNFRTNLFLSSLYPVYKILLEQSHLTPTTTPNSNQKLRIFLAIILVMFIILSNGYKNANVYRMVSPRLPLRYEKFSDLIEANFSIYTWSKLESRSWIALHTVNWFTQPMFIKRISGQHFVYFSEDSEEHLITRRTIISDIVEAANSYEPA